MNIFLTGSENAGKSTIIDNFLRGYSGTIGGFRSLRTHTSLDDYFGIYLTDIRDNAPKLTHGNRAGSCSPDGTLTCCRHVFETLGVSLLNVTPSPALIVMDELGVVEEACGLFQQAVYNCLDSHSSVLGVIKQKRSPFLDCVRERDDVTILHVDELFRDAVLAQITKSLST